MNGTPSQFLKALSGILFAVALVLSGQPPRAMAVDLIEIIEKEKAEPNQNQNGFQIENFDQWVFQNQKDLPKAIEHLRNRLQAEADSLQSTCELTTLQKQKLMLAGRGDIHEFTQLYAKIRAKLAQHLANKDKEALENVWGDIHPLQQKYNGQLHGKGSLFEKVLAHLLDPQQAGRLEQLRREQRKFQYRSAVRQIVLEIDRANPLTHEKREQLLAFFDQHTFAPRNFPNQNMNHYINYYVYGQMAQIPEDKLRPLFDKPVWEILQKQMKRGESMGANLHQMGLIPDNDQEDEFTRLKDARIDRESRTRFMG